MFDQINLSKACLRCKTPLPAETTQVCGACLKTTWHFEHLEIPFYYNAMARYLLHRLKFYQCLLVLPQLRKLLVQHLENYFTSAHPEVIIPMPLHRWRILKRGFNQAHELAKAVGYAYDIPINSKIAIKIKHTRAQAQLRAEDRHKNIKASFKVHLSKPLSHVLIIDDVFTTGSTANALAYQLKKAGIGRVDVVTLFRALKLF
jgi:ComF family protein